MQFQLEELLKKSQRQVKRINLPFKRYLFNNISWNNRLIGIKGARGLGKSTLLLQRLKAISKPPRKASYWSLDDLFFSNNSLAETAEAFYQQGGEILFLDEVHKYPNWSRHVKNLYDQFPDLKIVFTGSSIIDISKEEADLSRRSLMYTLSGMSFREFLLMNYQKEFPIIPFHDILDSEQKWMKHFPADFKPLQYFEEYLKYGVYPFSVEDKENFHTRLQQIIRLIVEYDMKSLKDFDSRNAGKLLQLLYIIASNVPFKPNLSDLAQKVNIHRNTLNRYLYFLEQAQLIRTLYPEGISISTLQKPEKIFLNNTNISYALAGENKNTGSLRESFFASQVAVHHHLTMPKKGDFKVDHKWTFEVGGKHKGNRQIEGLTNSFVVADDIDFPVSKLPLWLFGMLY